MHFNKMFPVGMKQLTKLCKTGTNIQIVQNVSQLLKKSLHTIFKDSL